MKILLIYLFFVYLTGCGYWNSENVDKEDPAANYTKIIKGDTGEQGANGVKGEDGNDGLNGKDGAEGGKGEKGAAGAKGVKGDKGESGLNGENGINENWLNVRTYGAKGDGVNDDTDAIQAAIDQAVTLKKRIYIPEGHYLTTSPLEVASDQEILGSGRDKTVIKNVTTTGIRKKSGLPAVERVSIRNIGFEAANDSVNNLVGLDATAFSYSTFTDISVRFHRTGILLGRGPASEACFFNTIKDVYLFANQSGLKIDDTTWSVNSNYFENLIIEDVGVWQGGNGVILSGYGNIFSGLYIGIPGGNSAVKIKQVSGSNIIIRLYGESDMPYLVDVGDGTSGRKNLIIEPHMDSLNMVLSNNLNDPDLTILSNDGFNNLLVKRYEPTLDLLSTESTEGNLWRLISGGGGEIGSGYFAIRNHTDGATPFLIASDAPTGGLIISKEGVAFGTDSAVITGYISGIEELDFFPITPGNSIELNVPVEGAAIGDTCYSVPVGTVENGLIWNSYIKEADKVTIRLTNLSDTSIDPVSLVWRADVWKH